MDRLSPNSPVRAARRRFSMISPSQPPSNRDSPATKRPRLNDTNTPTGSWTSASTSNVQTQSEGDDPAEFIDLRENDGSTTLSKALSKQREDAVKAQQAEEHEKGRSVLTAYRCPVCMDTPVDATTTSCGHLFCHKCIIDALKYNENRTDASGKSIKGTCPVCRKPLGKADNAGPRRSLVPLQLKLMKKKREAVAGPG